LIMRQTIFLACGVLCLTAAMAQADPPYPGKSHWLTKDRLAHPLRAAELGKADGSQIAKVFFGEGDPRPTIELLRTNPPQTRKEMRTLAGGIALEARKAEKGVQPDGRIALVWWDTKGNRPRRSTAKKDNAFDPKTDRLLAAVAVLDSKAIRQGKWVPWEERPVLDLPPGWPKAEANVLERGQAIGFAFGAAGPLSAGDFTAEASLYNAPRATQEDRTVMWLMSKNEKKEYVNDRDRVLVLIAYEYEKLTDHLPIGYRFYVISASGNLEVQFHAYLHDREKRLLAVNAELKRFEDNR
jgi:hypothetical protein